MAVEKTEAIPSAVAGPEIVRFRVEVARGVDARATAEPTDGQLIAGTAEGVSLRLSDPSVSRYHVEFTATRDGVILRDLGSTNGTVVGSVAMRDGTLRGDAEIQIGRTRLRLTIDRSRVARELSSATSFGGLTGASPAMRAVYNVLERAAAVSSPVLITGESGTGKELAARALHEAGARAKGPFEVVDCGGLPASLIEAELFGHTRGAFTGATTDRAGAFERADGGTLFLDELGELPIDVQPKLLRALGESEVRRIGGSRTQHVDVRVVAATNRDLRREVNAGRFRLDLFYRLAVIQLRLPALRERVDDLEMLTEVLVRSIARERGLAVAAELPAEVRAETLRHDWPGNVRELRNWLEQYLVLRTIPETAALNEVRDAAGDEPLVISDLTAMPLRLAKSTLLERFERKYMLGALAASLHNISDAARRAGVDRTTFFRAMRRYGIARDGGSDV